MAERQRQFGVLFGHAIHNFDRIRWFTGAEIATVYAKCGSLEPGVRVERSGCRRTRFVRQFFSGAQATLRIIIPHSC